MVTLSTIGADVGLGTTYILKDGLFKTIILLDLDKHQFVWTKNSINKIKINSIKNHSCETQNILEPLFETQENPTKL